MGTFDPSNDLPENMSDEQRTQRQLLEADAEREELELMHMTELGEDAKAFLASPIGHEMIARAREIITDCALDLVQTPASDRVSEDIKPRLALHSSDIIITPKS